MSRYFLGEDIDIKKKLMILLTIVANKASFKNRKTVLLSCPIRIVVVSVLFSSRFAHLSLVNKFVYVPYVQVSTVTEVV